MAQLIVRKLDSKLVGRLKRRAREHGVSMEEETRRLLRTALEPEKKVKPKMSLLDHLATMPNVGDDRDFDISRGRLEKSVFLKLKRRAAKEGLSVEEKLLQDLRTLATEPPKPKMNFKEFLLTLPDFGDPDELRQKDFPREINFT
jgi:plasmid stability protein